MTALFLYGPLAWQPLLAQVIGDATVTEAMLPEHELREETDQWWPVICAGGAGVPGVFLTEVSEKAIDRLEFYAVGIGVSLGKVKAFVGGQVHDAISPMTTTMPDKPGALWHMQEWQDRWGQLVLYGTHEAMGYFGKISAAELARRMSMIMARASARVAATGVPANVRSDTRADQVEIVETHARHAGYFLTREFLLHHPEFDGGMSPLVKREVFVATDAAIVLPYDPVRDRVLLVEQFRMGPFGRGDPTPWMLEPVAGRVDPGERPEQTAQRECVEEAGIDLKRLEHIASYYCSPGCSTEYFHCYLGICDLPDMAQGRGGLASEDEDIRTHVLTYEQAMALNASGEADNGPLILSLMWLSQMRDRLRGGA